MSVSDDSFRLILSNFKKRLTQKEQDDFEFATLDDVRLEMDRIQREQATRKEMMNMPRIQSFLEAMEQFSKVIEVFLNTSEFVAFIWGPMKFVLQVASTWAESFDILLGAYEQIGNQIPLLQQFQAVFNQNPHMRRVLEMIYSDILEFHKRAIRFFSGPVWRQVFRSAWKDFNTRFQNIVNGLRQHSELLQSQANLLHIQQYQADRLAMFDRLDSTEEKQRQEKYVAVMGWVLSAETKLDHDSACEALSEHPESGRWILKNSEFQNWKEADTPVCSILWLNGIPGAGKTVLASVVIESCLSATSSTTSFFYCKYGDKDKNSFLSILKGLLSQLICHSRDLIPFCYDKYLASGELTLVSTSLAKQLLDLFCQKIYRQYIIIDGLDECDESERKLILQFFTSMIDRYDMKEPGRIRVLFISQDVNDIGKALSTAAVIALGPSDNESDIRSFVLTETRKIQVKHDLDNQQVEHIVGSTCRRAQGMFLFVKLVMSNLYAQPTRHHLQEEIKVTRFPQGLGQAYERILSRIKHNSTPVEWKIARKLLGWMICAVRPLKWHEIQGAISIEPESQTVNFDDRRLRIHIRDICGSLVVLRPGDRIELVHSTAKFFITDTGHVRTPIVQCDLAALCMQYLTFECFSEDINQETLVEFAIGGYFAFQDYAVANWSHHFLAMIEAGQSDFAAESDIEETMEELENALNEFTQNFEEDFVQEANVHTSGKACKAFQQRRFHASLQLVWSHVDKHQNKGFEARNNVSLEILGKAFARNRELLEELTSSTNCSSNTQKDLESFYGDKRYKCPRLTCFYFHEGFQDAKCRDLHKNRHERPFQCTSPNCTMVEFGFRSQKEVDKHMKAYHPDEIDEAVTFAAANTVRASTPYVCPVCEKRFTRGFSLRNHIRSHNAERPYACSLGCGKAFTRVNDCKRHEKTVHARR
ncbi:hypothetical protein GJ744_002077 [Endocarpon pusillum]|uniref:C2H2-type domain-containing protein n=1 Tax=Endocarpon pusillum TaxID=364733 RepID=A0A8H7E079_9EURO|nr:hypothetical protein GJ744_002077 [Endocarpon pusillum]